MRIDDGFRAAYRELEARMKALAEADGDVFVPNPEPSGPVEYVFVCMEPSLGGWARSPDEARAKVEAGFRNFALSMGDFILHFCIRQYLCEPAERYYITDWSKGAMLTKRAGAARTTRYDRWYGLLLDEMDLVATPGAGIFAVGEKVAYSLRRRSFPRPFTRLIHYSPLAARARNEGIVGHEDDFERFKGSVTLEQVLATAEEVLNASVPASFREETLARLSWGFLDEFQQKLIFNYKLAFEAAGSRGIGRPVERSLNSKDRRTEEEEEGGQMINRAYWERRGSSFAMSLVDRLLDLVREATGDERLAPKYNQGYIGVARGGFGTLFFLLRPRPDDMVWAHLRIPRSQDTVKSMEAAGIEVTSYDNKWGGYRFRLGEAELTNARALLIGLMRQAYDARAGG